MFEISYRITGSIEELQTLTENAFDEGGDVIGFFNIKVNGNEYGDYHNLLMNGEFGFEYISYWFLNLAQIYDELNRSGYAAINVLNYINWIEFKRAQDTVTISIIRAEKPDGTPIELRLDPFENFEYGEWHNEVVKLSEIRNELAKKASLYLGELHKINAKLLDNRHIAELGSLVSRLN